MMKTYSLKTKQFLPTGLQYAWDFFSSPKNLAVITPTRLNFEILSGAEEDKIFQGQVIQYKITVLPMIRMFWETEITEVKNLLSFTDTQRKGPYAHWVHKHSFTEVDGGVEMTDEIEYAIPFGILGRFANHLFVEDEVKSIFDYRFKVLEKHFNKGQ
ncbi:MAG TPA: SRPBCC family protein [Bacteroidia bacterium]|nr:SRPBCC family protein [Bacteroidia bacterium]